MIDTRKILQKGGIKLPKVRQLKQEVLLKDLHYKFVLIKNKIDANNAVKAWGYDNIQQFKLETGYSYNDLLDAFFDLEDERLLYFTNNKKIYNSVEVKKLGKPILLLAGNPSRLYRESFKDYVEMYYRIDNNKYYKK